MGDWVVHRAHTGTVEIESCEFEPSIAHSVPHVQAEIEYLRFFIFYKKRSQRYLFFHKKSRSTVVLM